MLLSLNWLHLVIPTPAQMGSVASSTMTAVHMTLPALRTPVLWHAHLMLLLWETHPLLEWAYRWWKRTVTGSSKQEKPVKKLPGVASREILRLHTVKMAFRQDVTIVEILLVRESIYTNNYSSDSDTTSHTVHGAKFSSGSNGFCICYHGRVHCTNDEILSTCTCPADYRPVCTRGGLTIPNRCFAK